MNYGQQVRPQICGVWRDRDRLYLSRIVKESPEFSRPVGRDGGTTTADEQNEWIKTDHFTSLASRTSAWELNRP